jgi:cytochrome b
MQRSPASGSKRVVLVWDVPTRVFHWLVVALVTAAYATWKLNWMIWHGWIGETLLALLIFRLVWGFCGSETARFSDFMAAPRTAWRYLARELRRDGERRAGHNPAGGWMVLLLLALLIGETLTGLYVQNDVADEGPLTEFVPAAAANAITALHWIIWDALAAALTVHVLAILFYAVALRCNLVTAMVTGRADLPPGTAPPRMAGYARAVAVLAGAAAVTAALATYL